MGRIASTFANFLPFTPYLARGTREPCNLCGSGRSQVVSTWDRRLKRLTTVICVECGLVRTDPMPTEEELSAYYAASYRADYQFAGKAPPRYHRLRGERRAAERADFLAAVLRPGGRVLDVGSGAGEFLAAAAARGCSPLGLEPGEAYAAYARTVRDVDVMQASWDRVDLLPTSFDIITLHHVLEHLRTPIDALKKMATWLKEDGVLYISVPDISAGSNPAYERLHFAHVHGFAPETLRRAASEAGFVVDERFQMRGATMVFRRKRPGEVFEPASGAAAAILSRISHANPVVYIFGLGFLGPMVRRNVRTVADSLRRAPG